jgi:hypothetical protein
MSSKVEVKKKFLKEFQNSVIQARRLLQTGNHRWADKLLTDLYLEIEKSDWLDVQKKHQLIMILSNSWWMYINSLTYRDEEGVHIDIIKYIDAYKRFFSFLSKLDDYYLFNNFATNLLRNFIEMEEISLKGITKFINSFCVKVAEKEDYLKLIELQMLLMFIRKSVTPQEFFHFSMEYIGRTIFNIEPSKRALFLYVLLENVCLKYGLMEDSSEFVKVINKILINRIPSYLKNDFTNLNKIVINERNFSDILNDLDELVIYLSSIGEFSWLILIIKNAYSKIEKFQSYGDAVSYIRKFIDFAINRNRFEIAFEIYDYLEELFLYQTDLGYDNILIELWVEACKKFVDMKEKKYLLQSLEKLDTHLKLPQSHVQVFHYFYTCNILWQFKSMFFSLEERDFWRMMFYRAVYEENDFLLAQKILPFLDKNLVDLFSDPKTLFNETQSLQNSIYTFNDFSIPEILINNFEIKQILFRISSKGYISYRMISLKNKILEGKVANEYWKDAYLNDIFNEFFSDVKKKQYEFSLNEFGRILYIFIPPVIRNFLKQVQIRTLEFVPEIYFILDSMTIPFELVYDNNFFLLKYSIGYIIGEPTLGGISFDVENQGSRTLMEIHNEYHILVVDCMNSLGPVKWNESSKSKELIYPFEAGFNEFNYITNFFNKRPEVKSLRVLSQILATKKNILTEIESESYDVIHLVGNVFYSPWNPFDSYFLTNDNQVLKFSEINEAIMQNPYRKPLIFLNSQVYDFQGKKMKHLMKAIGDIVEGFDQESIVGIVARTYPIFNEETQFLISSFYGNLFKGLSQGISLLNARQECVSLRVTKSIEEQVMNLTDKESAKNIDIENTLGVSSYVLFGKPWKKLN